MTVREKQDLARASGILKENCNHIFLCLVLVEPKAPCYRAHVCVRNSGFSRIRRQQPETTFEQCSFDFRIPRRHDVDGNQ